MAALYNDTFDHEMYYIHLCPYKFIVYTGKPTDDFSDVFAVHC